MSVLTVGLSLQELAEKYAPAVKTLFGMFSFIPKTKRPAAVATINIVLDICLEDLYNVKVDKIGGGRYEVSYVEKN